MSTKQKVDRINEIIGQLKPMIQELEDLRYFEYLSDVDTLHIEVPADEPGRTSLVPIRDYTSCPYKRYDIVVEHNDRLAKHLEKYPQLGAYASGVVIDRDPGIPPTVPVNIMEGI